MTPSVYNRINAIIDFWFEGVEDKTLINKNQDPFLKWFKKDPSFDQTIRENFENDLIQARQGKYQSLEKSPQGSLALIVLCDQFPRNMFRNNSGMFAYDQLALRLALKMLKTREDTKLLLIQRVFVYLPLSHAEDLEIQKLSVQSFKKLVGACQLKRPENISYYEYNLEFAKRHCAIIERFGRFPHRNAILRRPSTIDEEKFLMKPGSKF